MSLLDNFVFHMILWCEFLILCFAVSKVRENNTLNGIFCKQSQNGKCEEDILLIIINAWCPSSHRKCRTGKQPISRSEKNVTPFVNRKQCTNAFCYDWVYHSKDMLFSQFSGMLIKTMLKKIRPSFP